MHSLRFMASWVYWSKVTVIYRGGGGVHLLPRSFMCDQVPVEVFYILALYTHSMWYHVSVVSLYLIIVSSGERIIILLYSFMLVLKVSPIKYSSEDHFS